MKKINFNFTKVKELFSSWIDSLKSKLSKDSSASKRQPPEFIKSFDFQKMLAYFQDFASPDKREFIHRSFLSLVFLTTAYYSGKGISNLVGKFITPDQKKLSKSFSPAPMPYPLERAVVQKIKDQNLFHTNLAGKEYKNLVKKPLLNLAKECKKADRKSRLSIKLLTTTVLQDSVKSIASVQVRSSKKLLDIREGDKISGMAKVSRIQRQYVILKNLKSGDCEYIERREDKLKKTIKVVNPTLGKRIINKLADKGIKNVGNHFSIKKSVRNNMLNDISKVLQQAKAIPIRTSDGSLNFKITEIVPGSIYSKLNIKENDIITKINGKPIKSMNEVMNMFGSFRDIDNLSLSVKREGDEENLDYQFE